MKKSLKEDFAQDFEKFIDTAWEETTERQIVKLLFKQKDKIKGNESKGKEFLTQFLKNNNSIIQNGCSQKFINDITTLTGDSSIPVMESKQSMQETEALKLIRDIMNFSSNGDKYLARSGDVLNWCDDDRIYKTDAGINIPAAFIAPSMYKLNEALKNVLNEGLLAYPHLLGPTGLAITEDAEDKVSPIDIEQLKAVARTIIHVGDYGRLFIKNDGSGDVFWIAGDADDGAEFTTPEEIAEKFQAVDGVNDVEVEFEAGPYEDPEWKEIKYKTLNKNIEESMYRYYQVTFINESKTYVAVPPFAVSQYNEQRDVLRFAVTSKQLNEAKAKNCDYVMEVSEEDFKMNEAFDEVKDEEIKPTPIDQLNDFDEVKDSINEHSMAWDKYTGKKHFAEDDETLDMAPLEEADETTEAWEQGYDACINGMGINKVPYNQKNPSFNEWIEGWKYAQNQATNIAEASMAWDKASGKQHFAETDLNESTTTADMNVPAMPATQDPKVAKKVHDLDVYGEDNDGEYIKDDEVLQEKFIKFVKRNCGGVNDFIDDKGVFYLQEFLNNRTYGYINNLQEDFKKSLTEDVGNELAVEDIQDNGDTYTIFYYYPSDENTRDITVEKESLNNFFESQDPSWENYYTQDRTGNEDYPNGFGQQHDTDTYFEQMPAQQQQEMLKKYLVSQAGVSATLVESKKK